MLLSSVYHKMLCIRRGDLYDGVCIPLPLPTLAPAQNGFTSLMEPRIAYTVWSIFFTIFIKSMILST